MDQGSRASGSADARRLLKVYYVASSFILVGLSQLTLLNVFQLKLNHALPVSTVMWMVIAMVCLSLLVFAELAVNPRVSWTLALVAVESVTMGNIYHNWSTASPMKAIMIMCIVLVSNVMIYAMGAYLPLFMLPEFYAMGSISVFYIVSYIIVHLIMLSVHRAEGKVLINIWTLLYMIPLMLYTASLIHLRRLPQVKTDDYLLPATFIAVFFLFMVHQLTDVLSAFMS